MVIVAAASVWDVLPALASVVVALTLLGASIRLGHYQHLRLETERETQLAEREANLARVEAERLRAQLLAHRLDLEAAASRNQLLELRGSTPLSSGAQTTSDRKRDFLARKGLVSVADADADVESSVDDLSFAAGAAEIFGRTLRSDEAAS